MIENMNKLLKHVSEVQESIKLTIDESNKLIQESIKKCDNDSDRDKLKDFSVEANNMFSNIMAGNTESATEILNKLKSKYARNS